MSSGFRGAYSYLRGQGYINGTGSIRILAKTGSCLSWLGGTMPLPERPEERADGWWPATMNAWAAAGAMNN